MSSNPDYIFRVLLHQCRYLIYVRYELQRDVFSDKISVTLALPEYKLHESVPRIEEKNSTWVASDINAYTWTRSNLGPQERVYHFFKPRNGRGICAYEGAIDGMLRSFSSPDGFYFRLSDFGKDTKFGTLFIPTPNNTVQRPVTDGGSYILESTSQKGDPIINALRKGNADGGLASLDHYVQRYGEARGIK